MDNKKQLNGAGFYAVLGLLVVALGVGGYALLKDAPADTPVAEVTDPVRQPEAVPKPRPAQAALVPPAPKPTPKPAPKPEPKPASQPAPMPEESRTVAAGAELPAEPEAPGLVVYPVRGQIAAAFSADELQYNETLDDWRVHDGIDLEARAGTTVLSACAGTVLSVADDPMMGTTVTVDHPGGYRTVYANLQSRPPVTAGDQVSAGQIIGAVGKTAQAECLQPPHLHFSVSRDGEKLDPEEFLNP